MTSADLGKGITKWKKEHYNTTGLNKNKRMEFINRHDIPIKMFTYHGKRKNVKKNKTKQFKLVLTRKGHIK